MIDFILDPRFVFGFFCGGGIVTAIVVVLWLRIIRDITRGNNR